MPNIQKDYCYIEKIVIETLKIFNCNILFNIEWNKRFRNRVADATYYSIDNLGRLRFSIFLWPYVPKEDRWNVVVHEACHLIDSKYQANAKEMGYNLDYSPHGRHWKSLMLKVGANPSRTWKPDFETAQKILRAKNNSYVKAKCKCKVHNITKNRATRIKNGKRYHCKLCGGNLALLTL